MDKQPNSHMCFVCGINNPLGLNQAFYTDDEGRCIARFRPRPEHQGMPGQLHGGISTTLLDETMGRVLIPQQAWAVTGRLEFRFRRPVPLDQELTVIGELTRTRSRSYEAKGKILSSDGVVLVEAKGVYVRVPDESVERVMSELGFWEVIAD
jgi:uncharacterized protein (TIGR00369 family)